MQFKSKFARRLEYKSQSQLDAIAYALSGRTDAQSLDMLVDVNNLRDKVRAPFFVPSWQAAKAAYKDRNRDRRTMTLAESVRHWLKWAETCVWVEDNDWTREDELNYKF
jgi:hypothetical protein